MHLEERLAKLEALQNRGSVPNVVTYTLGTAHEMLQAARRSWLPWRRRSLRRAAKQCLEHCEQAAMHSVIGPEFS